MILTEEDIRAYNAGEPITYEPRNSGGRCMRLYARGEFTWVRNSLWFKDDYLLALVPDEKYPEMFWIKFNDGTQSNDYYNLTRAREHAIELILEEFNKQVFDSLLKGQEIGLEAHGEV